MPNRYVLALILMVVMGTGSSVVGFVQFGVNRWTLGVVGLWVLLIAGYVLLGSRFQPDWMREEKRRRLEERDGDRRR